MSRKFLSFSAATAAAMLIVTVAGAEGFGANAQESGEAAVQTEAVTDETVPVFVSEEVVQPLPEQDDGQADAAASDTSIAPTTEASSLRELIAETPTGGTLSDQMECLAGAIYFEARGEPIAGQLAVGKVVINRSEDRRFPDSYCGVVYQRAQFSFVRGGTMPSIKRSSSAWKRAKAIARIAHQDLWESEAQDSLYFHANYVRPSWARVKKQRAAIKTHIFYR